MPEANPDNPTEQRQECDHIYSAWTLRGRGNLIRRGRQRVLVCDQCDATIEEVAFKHNRTALEQQLEELRREASAAKTRADVNHEAAVAYRLCCEEADSSVYHLREWIIEAKEAKDSAERERDEALKRGLTWGREADEALVAKDSAERERDEKARQYNHLLEQYNALGLEMFSAESAEAKLVLAKAALREAYQLARSGDQAAVLDHLRKALAALEEEGTKTT